MLTQYLLCFISHIGSCLFCHCTTITGCMKICL
uniref:Uncharacterized protein n=1 Tax=Rhizophora mucronata TaxID=61149 RepID=A0A2P2PVJ8_RHIMU